MLSDFHLNLNPSCDFGRCRTYWAGYPVPGYLGKLPSVLATEARVDGIGKWLHLAKGSVQHDTINQVVELGSLRKFVILYASHFSRCNN